MTEFYEDEVSPRFRATSEEVKTIIGASKQPMTIRQIVEKMSNTDFLWDALESLEGAGYIENVGGVLLSKYKLSKTGPRLNIREKVCTNCGISKPIGEYEREWSGEPAKKCRFCREKSLQSRDRKLVEYNRQRRLEKGEGSLPKK